MSRPAPTLTLKEPAALSPRVCRLAGCDSPVKARGLCSRCVEKVRAAGRLDDLALPPNRGQEAPKPQAPPPTVAAPSAPLPDDVPLLTIARAVGMVDAGDLVEMAARVVRMECELRRYRTHLDDIRCDILERGHFLADDSDPELTPRRLVRGVLARLDETSRTLNSINDLLTERGSVTDDVPTLDRVRAALDQRDAAQEVDVDLHRLRDLLGMDTRTPDALVLDAVCRRLRGLRTVRYLIDALDDAGPESAAHILAALRVEVGRA